MDKKLSQETKKAIRLRGRRTIRSLKLNDSKVIPNAFPRARQILANPFLSRA